MKEKSPLEVRPRILGSPSYTNSLVRLGITLKYRSKPLQMCGAMCKQIKRTIDSPYYYRGRLDVQAMKIIDQGRLLIKDHHIQRKDLKIDISGSQNLKIGLSE